MTRHHDSADALRGFDEVQVGELRRRVGWAVRRVCPRWLQQDRDDLVQASVMRIIGSAQRHEVSATPPSSYLLKVAHSVVMDEIRRRERRGQEAMLQDGQTEIVATEAAADDRIQARAIGRAILDCLAQLIATRRRAVTLHLLGHSVPETATRLSIDYKQANNLVFRGLADLRRCLSSKGVTP